MQTISTLPARPSFRIYQLCTYPRGRLANQPRSYHIRTCLQRKDKVPLLLQPLQPGVRFAPDLPCRRSRSLKRQFSDQHARCYSACVDCAPFGGIHSGRDAGLGAPLKEGASWPALTADTTETTSFGVCYGH
jgi:hypothetical protein